MAALSAVSESGTLCRTRWRQRFDAQHFRHGSPQAAVFLIDEVGESHEPVQINGKRGNAVLLSEADWKAILEGLATPPEGLSDQPGW